MTTGEPSQSPVARLTGVGLHYGKVIALNGVTLDIPAGRMVGLLGPESVDRSSLLSLLAGTRAVRTGSVHAFGGDMAVASHRRNVRAHIAYMPQGLGIISTPRFRWKKIFNPSGAYSDTMPPSAAAGLMS